MNESVHVIADMLVGELVWNILENAARHNPLDEKQVWVSGVIQDEMYQLIIADNGPGLSDSRKSSLFDKGQRSSGVGLTLISQMVRKYGGTIKIHDRVKGKSSLGAEFIVHFRLAEK